MDDLLSPNPDGCPKFESNPFKKEKCKSCGHPWTSHKGAIDDAFVTAQIDAKRKAMEDKLNAEAEKNEKLKAQAQAKKKAQQAPEDKWLMDDGAEEKHDDSDDDMGFRMFDPKDLEKSKPPADAMGGKPLNRVVNLLNFEEDDDEPAPTASVASAASASAPPAAAPAASTALPPSLPRAGSGGGLAVPGGTSPRPPQDEVTRLQAEVDHLQLMLESAKTEMAIQVDIVRDEVVEKQKLVDSLRADLSKVAATPAASTEVQQTRDQQLMSDARSARHAEELESLRNELAVAKAEAANTSGQASAATSSDPAQLDAARAEVQAARLEVLELRNLWSRTQQVLVQECGVEAEGDAQASTSHTDDLVSQLKGLRSAATSAEAIAARAGAERRRLVSRVAELEKAQSSSATSRRLLERASLSSQPGQFEALAAGHKDEQNASQALAAETSAEVVGRQATQALRDIRLNAEQHLAWIRKRIKLTNKDPVDGRC